MFLHRHVGSRSLHDTEFSDCKGPGVSKPRLFAISLNEEVCYITHELTNKVTDVKRNYFSLSQSFLFCLRCIYSTGGTSHSFTVLFDVQHGFTEAGSGD